MFPQTNTEKNCEQCNKSHNIGNKEKSLQRHSIEQVVEKIDRNDLVVPRKPHNRKNADCQSKIERKSAGGYKQKDRAKKSEWHCACII